jgi:hypothetical protein
LKTARSILVMAVPCLTDRLAFEPLGRTPKEQKDIFFPTVESIAGSDSLGPLASLTLLYTTDTNGFLQACGCSGGQVGGLAKRATVIKRLSASGATVLVDGGDLAPDLPRSEAVMDSLKVMRYQAIGLSGSDFTLGDTFLRAARRRELPMVACPFPRGEADGILASRIIEVAGRAIVVLALTRGSPEEIETAVRAAFESLGSRTALTIVLSALDFDEEQRLMRSRGLAGRCDLLIGMRGAVNREPRKIDGVMFVPAAQRGEVGVVVVRVPAGGSRQFSHRFEMVTDTLAPDRDVQEVVNAYYSRQARQLLESSLHPDTSSNNLGYEPPDRCADCHVQAVHLWQASKHSRAVTTLRQKDRLVSECLRCHSEFFRRTGKFNAEAPSAGHGVECATCHGDSVLHAALRGKEHVTRQVSASVCRGCHDPENDPKFDYAVYLEKIRHWPRERPAASTVSRR